MVEQVLHIVSTTKEKYGFLSLSLDSCGVPSALRNARSIANLIRSTYLLNNPSVPPGLHQELMHQVIMLSRLLQRRFCYLYTLVRLLVTSITQSL